MSCKLCERDAVYKCAVCGNLVCDEHVKLRAVCPLCVKSVALKYTIKKVTNNAERKNIRRLVKRFWGEEEQLTFDRKFDVAEISAYVAKVENKIVGFVSFTELEDNFVIVALGILPKYQGSGVGRSLVMKVEAEAKKSRKKKLLVSTSNDDLPALAFYQLLGFQIYEVKPNVIAEKHGKIVSGIGGLLVRDELRLQKNIC